MISVGMSHGRRIVQKTTISVGMSHGRRIVQKTTISVQSSLDISPGILGGDMKTSYRYYIGKK